jgi:hypothetical protein
MGSGGNGVFGITAPGQQGANGIAFPDPGDTGPHGIDDASTLKAG